MSAKILFVDDDPNILASFRRRLGRRYYVTIAISGQQAMNILANQGPFAVVICDERMRGMSGIDVLQTVRDTAPLTVRIMLTGNTEPATELRAKKEAGVFRYFTKPCRPEVLVDAISAGIRKYRQATEAARVAVTASDQGSHLKLVSQAPLANQVPAAANVPPGPHRTPKDRGPSPAADPSSTRDLRVAGPGPAA